MSFDRVKDVDLYKLLELDKDASESSIRSSYRRLAKTCHPDKSKDPDSVFKFHQLTDALNVLIEDESRDQYDKLLKKKEEEKRRNQESLKEIRKFDAKTRKLRKDLEDRERKYQDEQARNDVDQEQLIKTLRAEADLLLEKEKDDLIDRLNNLDLDKADQKKEPVLKLKWRKDCLLYTEESLRKIFSKYGEVENLVIKKHSAVIEFKHLESACIAGKAELGYDSSPLSVKPLFSPEFLSDSIFVKYDFVDELNSVDQALTDTEKYVFDKLSSL